MATMSAWFLLVADDLEGDSLIQGHTDGLRLGDDWMVFVSASLGCVAS